MLFFVDFFGDFSAPGRPRFPASASLRPRTRCPAVPGPGVSRGGASRERVVASFLIPCTHQQNDAWSRSLSFIPKRWGCRGTALARSAAADDIENKNKNNTPPFFSASKRPQKRACALSTTTTAHPRSSTSTSPQPAAVPNWSRRTVRREKPGQPFAFPPTVSPPSPRSQGPKTPRFQSARAAICSCRSRIGTGSLMGGLCVPILAH